MAVAVLSAVRPGGGSLFWMHRQLRATTAWFKVKLQDHQHDRHMDSG